MRRWVFPIDRALGRAMAAARWLVLPVSLLLFAQWPLRDLVQAGSRQANDLAQWVFALYVAFALTHASRLRVHLSAMSLARGYTAATRRRLEQLGGLVCILPWSLFILVTATPGVWQSLRQLEAFPDTYNPGYFLVKLAVWLLAALALLQAGLDAVRPGSEEG